MYRAGWFDNFETGIQYWDYTQDLDQVISLHEGVYVKDGNRSLKWVIDVSTWTAYRLYRYEINSDWSYWGRLAFWMYWTSDGSTTDPWFRIRMKTDGEWQDDITFDSQLTKNEWTFVIIDISGVEDLEDVESLLIGTRDTEYTLGEEVTIYIDTMHLYSVHSYHSYDFDTHAEASQFQRNVTTDTSEHPALGLFVSSIDERGWVGRNFSLSGFLRGYQDKRILDDVLRGKNLFSLQADSFKGLARVVSHGTTIPPGTFARLPYSLSFKEDLERL
jgi:hypothetical protein